MAAFRGDSTCLLACGVDDDGLAGPEVSLFGAEAGFAGGAASAAGTGVRLPAGEGEGAEWAGDGALAPTAGLSTEKGEKKPEEAGGCAEYLAIKRKRSSARR